jgi:hypothetical protein
MSCVSSDRRLSVSKLSDFNPPIGYMSRFHASRICDRTELELSRTQVIEVAYQHLMRELARQPGLCTTTDNHLDVRIDFTARVFTPHGTENATPGVFVPLDVWYDIQKILKRSNT